MNLKSLEYFVEVAKDLNVTSAAQRLYISQQALSLQIQKLERYYGVSLFERHPKFQLTHAGALLLEGAQKILQENTEIINSMSEISSSRAGSFRIGLPAYRAAECFPLVLPEFNRRWPNVFLQLVEGPSKEMLHMLESDALDVAIGTPTQEEIRTMGDSMEFSFLIDDRTYLICSDKLLEDHFGDGVGTLKQKASTGLDLRDFVDVPFMLHKPPMRLRKVEDACFNSAGIKPHVYIESSNTELMIALFPCHLAAFFCRHSRLPSLMDNFLDCNAFPIRYQDVIHQAPVYFMYRRHRPLPGHLVDFCRLMHDAWETISSY